MCVVLPFAIMPGSASVSFELRVQDYLAVREHLVGRALRRARTVSMLIFCAFTLALLALGMLLWPQPGLYYRGVACGVLIVGVTQFIAIVRIRRLCTPLPGKASFCHHTVAVSERGLEVTTPHWATLHAWAGIGEVNETANHVFFVHDVAAAHVVPKTAFGELSQLQEFVARARAQLEEARSAPGHPPLRIGPVLPDSP